MASKPSIGIIGSGRLGTALARQLLKAEYKVRIIGSKPPENLSLILKVLLPGAIAVPIPELALHSDVIILAIPLHEYTKLDPVYFKDKIVIDAMNYWPPTEGVIEAFSADLSSSEVIQQHFAQSKVVKTVNHVAYNELEQHALPEGSEGRRAIALAGDDKTAKQIVEALISDIGFDAVDAGPLSQGKKFQPDTTLFNTRYNKEKVSSILF